MTIYMQNSHHSKVWWFSLTFSKWFSNSFLWSNFSCTKREGLLLIWQDICLKPYGIDRGYSTTVSKYFSG